MAAHLRDYHPIEPYQVSLNLEADPPLHAANFSDIKGQEHVSGRWRWLQLAGTTA